MMNGRGESDSAIVAGKPTPRRPSREGYCIDSHEVADGGDNGLVGVEADLAIGLAPDKADRQSKREYCSSVSAAAGWSAATLCSGT
jgi:hypothetical protein